MAAKINQIILSIQGSQRWEQQVAFLSELPISQNTAKQLNSTKNAVLIKSLLENTRSKVVTTTCQFLIQLIQKYSPLMHNFVANLIGTDVVFRILNSSNKILWSSINQLIKIMVMTCGNQKFYTIFGQHMSSKNGQVRQCISGYILVLADMIQMPNKLIYNIKNWKNDANKTVRENAHKLQQILLEKNKNPKKNHVNKQNNIAYQYHIQQKKDQITKKVPMSQNSQIIMESFIKPDNQSSQLHLDQQSNIDFLITKIHSDQTWSLKVYAIQQLYAIFESNLERKQNKFFEKILVIFMELLDLKKSKVYIAIGNIIKKTILRQPQMFDKFIDKNFSIFVEKAGKNQQFGYDLISMTVNLDPTKYIIKLAQSSVDINSTKQKILFLDILVEKLCAHLLPTSKISSLLKLICRHIQKYSTHKQIYLPCLAILSQIKQAYPNQFLSCLLCQQKDILSKIIKIAENVDPRLRQAIINYIHSLKVNKNDKYQKEQERQKNQSTTVDNQQFRVLINEVSNNEESSVTKLVQYVFQQKKHVTIKQFYEIIKLTEKVVQKNSLVQLQILLQEICKSQNQKFLQGLFQAISTCNGNTIESQYILAYLRKVNTIFKTCSWLMSPIYVDKLISIYRFSKCPKIRLICIKTLSQFPNNLIQAYVNIKQKKLIQFQKKALT